MDQNGLYCREICKYVQGYGAAFSIELSGAWEDYNDGCIESLLQGEYVCYEIPFYPKQEMKVKLTYYDIYGNYYMQDYTGHYSEEENFVRLQTAPPELILRTDRLRYRQ